jgi:hypothetical protein
MRFKSPATLPHQRLSESGHSLIGLMIATVVTMIIVYGISGFLSEQNRSDKTANRSIQAAKVYDVVMHKSDCCQTLAHVQPVVGRSCAAINASGQGLVIKSQSGNSITGPDFKLNNDTKARFFCVDDKGLTKRLQLQINSKNFNGNWNSSFADTSNDTPFCVRELLDSTACSGVYAGASSWVAGSVTEGAPSSYNQSTTQTARGFTPIGSGNVDPQLTPYLQGSGQSGTSECGSPITVVCGVSGKLNLCNACTSQQ